AVGASLVFRLPSIGIREIFEIALRQSICEQEAQIRQHASHYETRCACADFAPAAGLAPNSYPRSTRQGRKGGYRKWPVAYEELPTFFRCRQCRPRFRSSLRRNAWSSARSRWSQWDGPSSERAGTKYPV